MCHVNNFVLFIVVHIKTHIALKLLLTYSPRVAFVCNGGGKFTQGLIKKTFGSNRILVLLVIAKATYLMEIHFNSCINCICRLQFFIMPRYQSNFSTENFVQVSENATTSEYPSKLKERKQYF